MIGNIRGTLFSVLTTGFVSVFVGVLVSLGSISSCFFTLPLGLGWGLSMEFLWQRELIPGRGEPMAWGGYEGDGLR